MRPFPRGGFQPGQRFPDPREGGFILPVAFGASLLLLLSSLSLQAVALQARLGLRQREALNVQEDALAAAAHQLVAALNRDHSCLLAIPLERWSRDGLSCASLPQQQALVQGAAEGGRWQLIHWQPAATRAEALIELHPTASTLPARRGSFVVGLLAMPLRAQPPGLLRLRGVLP